MAQAMNVRLSRTDGSPWGFRLQGGKDFGHPLLVQKVNGGSPAEKAGLQVGDAVIRVNTVDVSDMRHKEAQDTIIRAGNSFELSLQRGGGSVWRPHVSPVGQVPSPGKASPATVTKTSLAAGKSPVQHIGAAHNLSPKPFPNQVNGDPSVKAIVNKQYNTPVQMYSEETIAETLSAQAEVLAGGAIGVNFMKNEKSYDSQKSEVFKMVQEVDKEPREPEMPEVGVDGKSMPVSGFAGGLRHVQPLEPKPAPLSPQPTQLPPGQNICADCERLIVGVFVRIKDKNLHVECFKCATCGTSLKNVGYYNINSKLYCDIHAKMVARQNPPAPNLEPVAVPPGGKVPSSAFLPPQPIPQSPQPSTLAPLPFHAPRTTTSHVVAPWYGRQPSGGSAPKPFSSVSAPSVPFTPAPFSASFSAVPPPPAAPKPAIGLSSSKPNTNLSRGAGKGALAGATAPKRGRGVLNQGVAPGARIPLCGHCNNQIRGPFITALGKIWCPEHFVCVNPKCKRPLQDIGFVEEQDGLYCEFCFEQYLAPTCDKCHSKIKGDCLNAIGRHFHPECFSCSYCGKLFGNNPFFLEDALPYCESDWNELFTTKCFSCGFPIEAGDRWVEALSNNYHSQCFNCSMCKKNLEGQSFFAKGGRPFCKNHAR